MARVLIVDDDKGIRNSVRALLEDEGLQVSEAPNGPAALALLRDAAPCDVLLDLVMPGVDGATVLRAVAAEPQLAARHAFIAFTASRQVPPPPEALGGLVVPLLPKPFEMDDLFRMVVDAAGTLPAPEGA